MKRKPEPAPREPMRASMQLWERPTFHIASALVGMHLLFAALLFDPTPFTGGDNGVYVALSKSIVERHTYISLHDPQLKPHTYYPPGYPAILAVASFIGIRPWTPIKILTVFFSAAGVLFSYLLLRRRASQGVALFATLLIAASPGLLALSHVELSDVPFWAFMALALWAYDAIPERSIGRAIFGAVGCAVAYMIRSAAVPMIVSALIYFALRKRWRELITLVVVVVPPAALWWVWTHTHAGGDLYGRQFWYITQYQPELGEANIAQVIGRIPENVQRYTGMMIPLLFTARAGGTTAMLAAVLLALSIYGWILRVRQLELCEIFFPLYGGMLLVCPPIWAGERYLLPIVPLALQYAAEAGQRLIRKIAPGAVVPSAIAALALVALIAFQPVMERAVAAGECRRAYSAGEHYACLPPAWQDFFTQVDWVRTSLPPDAVVITRKPGLFFSYSGHRSIDVPKTSSPENYLQTAERAGARFLLLDQTDNLTLGYSGPVIQKYTSAFCVVRMGAIEGAALLGIRYDSPRVAAAPVAGGIQLTMCPADFVSHGMKTL